MSTLDEVRAGVHACPDVGLTCRPGRGILYPTGPWGRLQGERADILLVGWNPRNTLFDRHRAGTYDEWRAECESALERQRAAGAPLARQLQALLPEGHTLDDGRVMATWLWKWPTRIKGSGAWADDYARRCMATHWAAELAALRPRVLLSHESEAAQWLADEAARRGLALNEPAPGLRRSEIAGWCPPSDAWGWPMGLVLVKDAPEGGYDRDTLRWSQAASARVLRESGDLTPG